MLSWLTGFWDSFWYRRHESLIGGIIVPCVRESVRVSSANANLTDADMNTRSLRLGFAAGAAGAVFYIAESYYLRREEKLDKRQRRPKDP